MSERIAYFNGKYIREGEAKISIIDRGFVNGDAAFDVARTFNHQAFEWEEHIERWFRSLCYMQIDIGMTQEEVLKVTEELFNLNKQNLKPNDDYWVRWVGTPGEHRFVEPPEPTVVIYCVSIPFESLAQQYIDGVHIVVVSNRAVPSQCLDAKAKLYSRANYVLAELEARAVDPDALPVLLDLYGHVTECPRQNIFIIKGGKLLTPTRNNILEGVTRATTLRLAKEIGIETLETDLCVYDLYNADEIFISATSFVILPVSKFNKIPLKELVPGPVTKRLFSVWNKLVGLDIVQQAFSHVQSNKSDS